MTKNSDANEERNQQLLSQLSLGKAVGYAQHYSPVLLQGVPRSLSRDEIGLDNALPFDGIDIWNGYELSWLNARGKPQIAILRCSVPIDSENLIESKSFKLYLNSFNQTRFESQQSVEKALTDDLSRCASAPVNVEIIAPERFNQLALRELSGTNIDHLDIEISDYQLQPDVLQVESNYASETLTSNLLKSNCLITNQPDWASVQIKYQGPKINQQSLLRYLISFRMHNEFHEQCVERIFCDIKNYCQPERLSVYAQYTRRGGLDINPFRTDFEFDIKSMSSTLNMLQRSARQ